METIFLKSRYFKRDNANNYNISCVDGLKQHLLISRVGLLQEITNPRTVNLKNKNFVGFEYEGSNNYVVFHW